MSSDSCNYSLMELRPAYLGEHPLPQGEVLL